MNPKAQDFFKVADILRPYALRLDDDCLDMSQSAIRHLECGYAVKCGTTHCVAGWYYLARKSVLPKGQYIGYTAGATLMAKDLGFTSFEEFEDWCTAKPYLWGNSKGQFLFSGASAWNGAVNLMDIVNHLVAVGKRISQSETT